MFFSSTLALNNSYAMGIRQQTCNTFLGGGTDFLTCLFKLFVLSLAIHLSSTIGTQKRVLLPFLVVARKIWILGIIALEPVKPLPEFSPNCNLDCRCHPNWSMWVTSQGLLRCRRRFIGGCSLSPLAKKIFGQRSQPTRFAGGEKRGIEEGDQRKKDGGVFCSIFLFWSFLKNWTKNCR